MSWRRRAAGRKPKSKIAWPGELDPLSPTSVMGSRGWRIWRGATKRRSKDFASWRRPPLAIRWRLDLWPVRSPTKGDYPGALKMFQQMQRVMPSSQTLAQIGNIHARSGNVAEARKILQQLLAESRRQFVSPICFVSALHGSGRCRQLFPLPGDAPGAATVLPDFYPQHQALRPPPERSTLLNSAQRDRALRRASPKESVKLLRRSQLRHLPDTPSRLDPCVILTLRTKWFALQRRTPMTHPNSSIRRRALLIAGLLLTAPYRLQGRPSPRPGMKLPWPRCRRLYATLPGRRNTCRPPSTTGFRSCPSIRLIPCMRRAGNPPGIWTGSARRNRRSSSTRTASTRRTGPRPAKQSSMQPPFSESRPRAAVPRGISPPPAFRLRRTARTLLPLRHPQEGQSRAGRKLLRHMSHPGDAGWQRAQRSAGKFPCGTRALLNLRALPSRMHRRHDGRVLKPMLRTFFAAPWITPDPYESVAKMSAGGAGGCMSQDPCRSDDA